MTMSRRFFDIMVSAAALIVLSPLLAVIAVAIAMFDGPPVLFVQERVGFSGRRFGFLKFRTMRIHGAGWHPITVGEDRRITRLGRVLRRWKLDEFPQLVNVLRGEMSLVGPRPEIPRYVALYTRDQKRVLDLVPGITGAASVAFSDEASILASAADPEALYVSELIPEKIRLDLAYAARQTLWTDVVMLIRTVALLATPSVPSRPFSAADGFAPAACDPQDASA